MYCLIQIYCGDTDFKPYRRGDPVPASPFPSVSSFVTNTDVGGPKPRNKGRVLQNGDPSPDHFSTVKHAPPTTNSTTTVKNPNHQRQKTTPTTKSNQIPRGPTSSQTDRCTNSHPNALSQLKNLLNSIWIISDCWLSRRFVLVKTSGASAIESFAMKPWAVTGTR